MYIISAVILRRRLTDQLSDTTEETMKSARLAAAILALVLSCSLSTMARADGYEGGIRVTKILTATTASNGQKLSYLRTDNPEVTAMTVEIPPGVETGWHTHGVPVYAYVLDGKITVEMAGGATYDFTKGDAIIEVRDTPHNGRNTGDTTARLLVFYTGAVGTPNVTRVTAPK